MQIKLVVVVVVVVDYKSHSGKYPQHTVHMHGSRNERINED